MANGGKDFYRVLGVPENADADAIRKAYRKLAKKYHPDANQGDPAAAERFKEIGEAYGVLSDPEKRARYDQMRKFGAFDPYATAGARGPGAGQGGFPGGGFSFEDLGGLGDLGDLFGSIFDRGRRGGRGGTRAGRDVEYLVEVPFETAVLGGKVTIEVPVTEECATCSGSGAAPGTQLRPCGPCGGTGSLAFGQGGFTVNRTCPTCLGRGKVPETPCRSCGGSGSVTQNRKVQVTVPAGTETGSRLRLTGQGERGAAGGPAGHLILTFQVRPHSFFRREGSDIHVTVPINLAQATLGSKIRVRTVDGRKVELRIPPGTQTGTRFRVRGQGVETKGRRGDQIVEVRIEVPESLSEEGKERMKAFAESSGLRY